MKIEVAVRDSKDDDGDGKSMNKNNTCFSLDSTQFPAAACDFACLMKFHEKLISAAGWRFFAPAVNSKRC